MSDKYKNGKIYTIRYVCMYDMYVCMYHDTYVHTYNIYKRQIFKPFMK